MITLTPEQHAKFNLAQSVLEVVCAREFVEDFTEVNTANDLLTSIRKEIETHEDEEECSPKKIKGEATMTEQNPMENPPETTININELEAMKESIVIIEKQFDLVTPNKEVHNSFRTIKNTLKEKLAELVVIENNLKKKKKIDLYKEQIKLIEEIRETCNLNLVSCCQCGFNFFHDREDEEVECPNCLQEIAPEDCEDVFYSGMNVDGEQVK